MIKVFELNLGTNQYSLNSRFINYIREKDRSSVHKVNKEKTNKVADSSGHNTV